MLKKINISTPQTMPESNNSSENTNSPETSNHAIGIGIYLFLVIVIASVTVIKLFPDHDFYTVTPTSKHFEFPDTLLNDSTIITGVLAPIFASETGDTIKLDLKIEQFKKGKKGKKESTVTKSSNPIIVPSKKLPPKKLFILIILVGAIGASIHGITSLVEYVGNQDFKPQWTLWYLFRPFVGASLAFVFYFFVKSGLFEFENTTTDLYGMLAIAGIIGLFSKQALYKISDIVDVLFLSNKERFLKDKLTEISKPQLTEIKPDSLEISETSQKITLIGTKFINGAKVFVGETELKTVEFDSSTQITVELTKEHLNKEGNLAIKVVNPDSGETSIKSLPIKKKVATEPVAPPVTTIPAATTTAQPLTAVTPSITTTMTMSEIFIPKCLLDKTKEKEFISYYKQQHSFDEIKEFIYGGQDLRTIITNIGFEIIDLKNLLVNIELKKADGTSAFIKNFSFRQLTLESSNNYLDTPKRGWKNLEMQQRLEICQHELSRWSLLVKAKDFMPTELEFINSDDFQRIELINNCTTSKGFELKITANDIKYHGSFSMPEDIYQQLCVEQAGALAKQGWFAKWDQTSGPDADHGLVDSNNYPNKIDNPTFGQIYWEEESHARDVIKIDLSVYRKIAAKIYEGTVELNLDQIDYNRWSTALGPDNEYVTKPKVRKLIAFPSDTKKEYLDPPQRYSEILDNSYQFYLPLFLENGLYNVLESKEKKHYQQLATLVNFQIDTLENGLQELKLFATNPANTKRALTQIVIGNIDLNSIPMYPAILTIDRFCFAPRPTSMSYDHAWMPPSIQHKQDRKATYAFLLSGDENIFIQAENWGVERVILSKEDDQTIVIDLMSYERIVPVWQGKIILEKDSNT